MQPIHYFQRYSQPENVATNNTLLLLSRIYHHSPRQFNILLNDLLSETELQAGVIFAQQERHRESVPDGSISQESFQIIIETKRYDNFPIEQLIGHCKAFNDSKISVLLSLSPGKIQNEEIEAQVKKYNLENNTIIRHIHLTFKEIIECCKGIIDENDFEFLEIIDDYEEYCFDSGLIDESDKWMRAVTCGMTLEENFKYNLYYEPASRGCSNHGYIGVYANKSIKGIGQIVNIVTADYIDEELGNIKQTNSKTDVVPEDQKKRIIGAIKAANEHRKGKIDVGHKFFMVENFYKTSFEKETKSPLRRTKFFNLCNLLNVETLPNTNEIAEKLKKLKW